MTGGNELPAGTPLAITVTFTQTGATVGGAFGIQGAYTGPVSGTLRGALLTFTLTPPCNGALVGFATVAANDSTLAGTVSGSDCGGTVKASVALDRG